MVFGNITLNGTGALPRELPKCKDPAVHRNFPASAINAEAMTCVSFVYSSPRMTHSPPSDLRLNSWFKKKLTKVCLWPTPAQLLFTGNPSQALWSFPKASYTCLPLKGRGHVSQLTLEVEDAKHWRSWPFSFGPGICRNMHMDCLGSLRFALLAGSKATCKLELWRTLGRVLFLCRAIERIQQQGQWHVIYINMYIYMRERERHFGIPRRP